MVNQKGEDKKMKKVLSIALCFALILNISITAFAANETNSRGISFSATLSNAQLGVSSTDQTVEMTIFLSSASTVASFEFNVSCDSPISVVSVDTSSTVGSANEWNSNTKFCAWAGSTDVTTNALAKITLLIPANTGAGSYSVGVSNIAVGDVSTGLNYWEDGASATATLTIVDGYTATIANGTAAETIRVGDTIYVNVGSNKDFAATEMTISYNPSLVEFNKAASDLGNATVTDNGGLQLADYGKNKAAADKYKLAFTAIKDGTAVFTVVNAAFGTGTSAETANLTNAGASGELKITIAKKQHTVTLPNIFTGTATVNDGESYTFTPETATGAYYYYTDVTATMGGNSATVTGDATAGWTIANVTGDLVISGTRTPKQYNVTVNGEGNAAEEKVTLPAGQPTYLTDYTFTIPANKAANTEAGYTYELTSMTIGGTAHTGYQVNGREYTILGTAITGDVVITVTKTVVDPNQFTVGKTGNGAGDAVIAEGTVAKDANAVLALTEDKLYKYTVSATMGGETAEVTKSGNTYTVSAVNGAVVFTVTKTLNIDTAEVKQYVQLNGTSLWLVTINGNGTEQISGKTYSFNGSNMYWSSQYKCYVTLVAATQKPTVTAGFELVTVAEVPAITYGMDVNGTGDTDANDAQLVYNMYSAVYVNFTDNVPMEKFLRADVNGDKTVNTSDAAAIINSILGLSNN